LSCGSWRLVAGTWKLVVDRRGGPSQVRLRQFWSWRLGVGRSLKGSPEHRARRPQTGFDPAAGDDHGTRHGDGRKFDEPSRGRWWRRRRRDGRHDRYRVDRLGNSGLHRTLDCCCRLDGRRSWHCSCGGNDGLRCRLGFNNQRRCDGWLRPDNHLRGVPAHGRARCRCCRDRRRLH
jgi:hypothetical protein